MFTEHLGGRDHVVRRWHEDPAGDPVPIGEALRVCRATLCEPCARDRLRRLVAEQGPLASRELDAALEQLLRSRRLVVERRRRVASPRRAPRTPTQSRRRAAEPEPIGEEAKPRHWIEIELVDDYGEPVPFELFQLVLPDGTKRLGNLDARGLCRVDGIPGGVCEVTFPRRHADAWRRA